MLYAILIMGLNPNIDTDIDMDMHIWSTKLIQIQMHCITHLLSIHSEAKEKRMSRLESKNPSLFSSKVYEGLLTRQDYIREQNQEKKCTMLAESTQDQVNPWLALHYFIPSASAVFCFKA